MKKVFFILPHVKDRNSACQKTERIHNHGCFNSFIRRFLSYRNQSIDFCTNQWSGFYMIGTFVMKELTGQTTVDVIDCYKKNNICDVLDDMTKY